MPRYVIKCLGMKSAEEVQGHHRRKAPLVHSSPHWIGGAEHMRLECVFIDDYFNKGGYYFCHFCGLLHGVVISSRRLANSNRDPL